MTYELHPLCTLFPRMAGAEFDALVADIKAHGLRQPIVLHEGMILDGGNRYRACVQAGVDPACTQFVDGNIVSFVLSANLHRRHMTPGQQAAIVASAQNWAKAQTSGSGGDRRSSATLHLIGAVDRAEQSGASLRTQKMADKVAKDAPELAVRVAHGEVSLPQAHRMAASPKVNGHDHGKRAVDDEAFGDTNPAAEWERTQRELDAANRLIESLQTSDHAREIVRLTRLAQSLEVRLSDEMGKNAVLQRQLDGYGKWYAELRKLTGADARTEIARWIKEAKNSREDAL